MCWRFKVMCVSPLNMSSSSLNAASYRGTVWLSPSDLTQHIFLNERVPTQAWTESVLGQFRWALFRMLLLLYIQRTEKNRRTDKNRAIGTEQNRNRKWNRNRNRNNLTWYQIFWQPKCNFQCFLFTYFRYLHDMMAAYVMQFIIIFPDLAQRQQWLRKPMYRESWQLVVLYRVDGVDGPQEMERS